MTRLRRISLNISYNRANNETKGGTKSPAFRRDIYGGRNLAVIAKVHTRGRLYTCESKKRGGRNYYWRSLRRDIGNIGFGSHWDSGD